MPRQTQTHYQPVGRDEEVNATWANNLIRVLEERDLLEAETQVSWIANTLQTSQLVFRTPDSDAPNTGTEGYAEFPTGDDRSMVVPFQTPSVWVPGSPRVLSVRWSKATSGSGAVDWQMRFRYRSVGSVVTSWSSWTTPTVWQSDGNTAGQEAESYWEMDADSMPFLSTFEAQFKRFGSTDAYAATVTLWSVALYLQCDFVGGQSPWDKNLSVGV